MIRKCQETTDLFRYFQKLFEHNLFEFLIKSDLVSSRQSGFKKGNSFICQLLSITHEIYQSFDNSFDLSIV